MESLSYAIDTLILESPFPLQKFSQIEIQLVMTLLLIGVKDVILASLHQMLLYFSIYHRKNRKDGVVLEEKDMKNAIFNLEFVSGFQNCN